MPTPAHAGGVAAPERALREETQRGDAAGMVDADNKTSTLRLADVGLASEPGAERWALVVYGRDGGDVVFIDGDDPRGLVVGRAAPADLVLAEPSLSRQHARFVVDAAADAADAAVVVTDLHSKNGTALRGVRLTAPTRLRVGDELALGEVTVRVERASSRTRTPGLLSHDAFFARTQALLAGGARLTLHLVRAKDAAPAVRFFPALSRALPRQAIAGLYAMHTVELCIVDDDGAFAAAAAGAGLDVGRAEAPADGKTLDALLDCAVLRLTAEQRAASAVVDAAVDAAIAADTLDRVAPSLLPVLIMGETGAGKEVMARALHDASGRKGKFVAVNCGSLPSGLLESTLFGHEKGAFTGAVATTKGVFETAQGGTVFLDELGELSPQGQAALLRVLEVKKIQRIGSIKEINVDVRLLCATHKDIPELVQRGAFRQDLYFRLNAFEVVVAPLRERRGEIPALAERLRVRGASNVLAPGQAAPAGFTAEATSALTRYAWPGNVRELKNVVERALVIARGPLIDVHDLPEAIRAVAPVVRAVDVDDDDDDAVDDVAGAAADSVEGVVDGAFKDRLRRYEERLILDALEKSGGVQTKAAKLLGMPLRTLVHKIKTYGIKARSE